MTQSPKDRAVERLVEIEAQAKQLRQFIKLYDELAGSNVDVSVDMHIDMHVNSSPSTSPSFATKEEIWDAVRDILRDETEPMHISYLFKLVTTRGLRIGGQKPKSNLSAKLAPLNDVIYLKDKGWILRQNMNRFVNALSGSTNGNGSDRESLPSPETSNPAHRGA